MPEDRTNMNMRVLIILSYIAIGLGALLPLVNQLEGKRPDPSSFAYLLAGLIGVYAYGAFVKMSRRISDLEKASGMKSTEDAGDGSP
jgi:uncharacterized membrane protein YuzA (DUF378 family)